MCGLVLALGRLEAPLGLPPLSSFHPLALRAERLAASVVVVIVTVAASVVAVAVVAVAVASHRIINHKKNWTKETNNGLRLQDDVVMIREMGLILPHFRVFQSHVETLTAAGVRRSS